MRSILASMLAAAMLLAGCASIPSGGKVEQVTMSPGPGANGGADIAPVPPADGASEQQIVGGFLVAMAAGSGGLPVAKSYLTPEAASSWTPAKHPVEIYAGDAALPGEPGTLSAPRVGVLDVTGHYAAGAGRIGHNLNLTKVAGQWRIGTPPAGLLLSEYMFGRYYQGFPIYFINRHSKLIPELVYLHSAVATPTQLLEAMVAGPSPWLAPSVLTALPAGATVSVSAADQVARVSFDASVNKLGEEDRRRLGAQVIWTLSSFPRIVGVTMTAGGVPFEVPGQSADGVLDLASQQGYQVLSGAQTSELYAVSAGRLGRTSERGGFMAVPGALGQAGAGVRQAALSADGVQATAVLADDRLWFGNVDAAGQAIATGLTSLADPQALLNASWAAGTTASGESALVRVQGSEVKVAAVPSEVGRVLSFRVQPSGSAVAVVAERDGQRRLGLMRVDETSTGPVLADWRPVVAGAGGTVLTDFQDVDWADETTMLVSARGSASNRTAFTVSYDGAKVAELGPPGGFNLTAVSTQPRKSGLIAVVTSADGQILRFDARARWQAVTLADVQQVSYAG